MEKDFFDIVLEKVEGRLKDVKPRDDKPISE
jgi:hypothetical protein